jgi:hypothetical protein
MHTLLLSRLLYRNRTSWLSVSPTVNVNSINGQPIQAEECGGNRDTTVTVLIDRWRPANVPVFGNSPTPRPATAPPPDPASTLASRLFSKYGAGPERRVFCGPDGEGQAIGQAREHAANLTRGIGAAAEGPRRGEPAARCRPARRGAAGKWATCADECRFRACWRGRGASVAALGLGLRDVPLSMPAFPG